MLILYPYVYLKRWLKCPLFCRLYFMKKMLTNEWIRVKYLILQHSISKWVADKILNILKDVYSDSSFTLVLKPLASFSATFHRLLWFYTARLKTLYEYWLIFMLGIKSGCPDGLFGWRRRPWTAASVVCVQLETFVACHPPFLSPHSFQLAFDSVTTKLF